MRFATLLSVLIFAQPFASAQDGQEASLPSIGDDWTLVWADEFSGTEIDQEKWSHEVDCWGGGNEERQCYTPLPTNSFVADGVLSIVARYEGAEGPALPAHLRANAPGSERDATKIQPFTSARLITKGKADWTYGRFEARAKMPEGQGLWPAIWMLPTEETYGAWAASGEIDIVEAVNMGAPCDECESGIEDRILGTIHYGGEWPHNKYKGKETTLPPSEDGFYTYAVEWEAGKIKWFVDGVEYYELTSKDWRKRQLFSSLPDTAPFDQPFYMILNFAVGGHLAEARNAGGVSVKGFPKTMQVDWIRVYQKRSDEIESASQP